MADVNIRRLVEDASLLERAGGAANRRHHPLGHRIPRDARYSHSGEFVYLPKGGDGLERLQAAIKAPVLDLHPDFSGSAWRALLASDSSLSIPTPRPEQLLAEDIAVAEGRHKDLRRVALYAVLRPGDEALEVSGSLVATRFAGAATLTLLIDPDRPTVTTDAWIVTEWKQSTATLASWFSRQLQLAGPSTVDRFAVASAGILVHPARSGVFDSAMMSRLVAHAAAFGLRARVLDRGRADFGSIQQSLQRELPSALIAFGPPDVETTSLVGGYRSASGRQVLHVDSADPSEALPILLDAFAQTCGVSASLHVVGTDDVAGEGLSGRPVPPIAAAAECRHDSQARFYLRDAETDLWWTLDTAGHGGSVFKTYRQEGGVLVHEACRDGEGRRIDKWKGPVGQTIPMKDLHGCEDAGRHL